MAVIEQAEVTAPLVTTRDVLHRAADLMEEVGWDRGMSAMAYSRDRKSLCILGACVQARLDFGEQADPEKGFYTFGWEPLRDTFATEDDAWGFNDAPGRTKAEVVAKLREAAEAA